MFNKLNKLHSDTTDTQLTTNSTTAVTTATTTTTPPPIDSNQTTTKATQMIGALRNYIDESRRLLHRDIANVQLDVCRQFDALVDEQRQEFSSLHTRHDQLYEEIVALRKQNQLLIQRLLF